MAEEKTAAEPEEAGVEMPEAVSNEENAADQAADQAPDAESEAAEESGGESDQAPEGEPDAAGEDRPAEEDRGNPESAASTKKGPFKKKEKKKDKRDERIEELADQLRRQMAEFENFRKRTEKEKNQMYEIGAKDVVEKILPVADNFERGLSAVPEEQRDDPFVDGMDKVYKQLLAVFEELEVAPIEAVGKEFDPEYHNAVMQVESDEYETGIVAQELQKGYTYRGSVVRHSMVAVVQ